MRSTECIETELNTIHNEDELESKTFCVIETQNEGQTGSKEVKSIEALIYIRDCT